MHGICTYFSNQISNGENLINKDCILLNTCSTAILCYNTALIDKIKYNHAQETLDIFTNEVSQRYNKMAQLKLFPTKVHHNLVSLESILSFKYVAS